MAHTPQHLLDVPHVTPVPLVEYRGRTRAERRGHFSMKRQRSDDLIHMHDINVPFEDPAKQKAKALRRALRRVRG